MNAHAFATGLDPGRVEPLTVDCVSDLGSHGADESYNPPDSADLERLRPPVNLSAKRGRGRPKLDRDRSGNIIRGKQDAERKPAAGWLTDVQACLGKADCLTDGQLPVKLAQAVAMRSESMSVVDVVSAFEKCENMALKLKAAKFLKETSKGTMEELRQYAANLLVTEEHDETAQ